MTPYKDLSYFVILALVIVPMIPSGARGRADGRWIIGATVMVLLLTYLKPIHLTPGVQIPELMVLLAFGIYVWLLLQLALRTKGKSRVWWVIPAGLLPLAVAKCVPLGVAGSHLGFAGISYVTFRVLDVLWMVTDGVLTEIGFLDLAIFVFFFPTLASGPIDRFRRFKNDWRKRRTAAEFWQDLDAGVQHIFRGLLYKFIIALLIDQYMKGHVDNAHNIHGAILYGYVYSMYLFFDFAGYSAFAVGVSRCFGVRTPENFNLPFWSVNIRDFWNRWHISLSMWFRDHVYTRFLLMAVKRKWFKRRETASNLGYLISFGLMGVWHAVWQGFALNLIVYGLYHAALMIGYDMVARWKKKNSLRFKAPGWIWVARFITFNFVCFGFWIFSGHGIIRKEPTQPPEPAAAVDAKPPANPKGTAK